MKTTVRTNDRGRVIAEPLPEGRIQLTINLGAGFGDFATVELDQAQAGALIFGLEQAAEAAGIAQDRKAHCTAECSATSCKLICCGVEPCADCILR